MIVRFGTKDEIDQDKFQLFTEGNDGDTIIVAESKGEIVGFAQLDGEEINFMESLQGGAGIAMVRFLKDRYDHLVATRTDNRSASFWIKMGFQHCGGSNYDWYPDGE